MGPVELWIRHQRARGFAPTTLKRRTVALGHLARHLDPLPIEQANTDLISDWLLTLPAAATRTAYLNDARLFYRWAHKRHLITEDPTDQIESVKRPRPLPRPIDAADLAVAMSIACRDDRRAIALGAYASLRVSEIARLAYDDIVRQGQRWVVNVRAGKGGRDRSVPAHPVLVDNLELRNRSGPVIPHPRGGHLTADTISRRIAAVFRSCGIEATPHALRHTFGTELARISGGNLVLAAALMGHSSMDTTIGYTRLSGDGADIVDRMFSV